MIEALNGVGERRLRVDLTRSPTPPPNDLYLRTADDWSRRIADVADRRLGRPNWAESTPTRVASGRTGVWTKAGVPLRAPK